MALWGGRFSESADQTFKRFNDSLPVDHVLLHDDVQGSIAWANALAHANVITTAERDSITSALSAIASEYADKPQEVASAGDEDIHAFVERNLIQRVGDLGKKLHTGRSRNDQVATDLRLYTKRRINHLRAELTSLRDALITLADDHTTTLFPGFTHLQLAQPIVFAHWCLAYAEMLDRDDTRLQHAHHSTDECPLGCGALAGTAYPIDRETLATSLHFARASRNSLDAASDRDFVLDTLHALATIATHLSRLAEDLIVYASGPFALVTMSDRVSTGSSLMPQKKNPDALELIRGKSATLITAPAQLATTIKSLPLAYNKDMQEDKPLFFRTCDEAELCLAVCTTTIQTLTINKDRAAHLAAAGYTNATDLADALVAKHIPFRESHELTGRLVNIAIQHTLPLEQLTNDHLAQVDPRLTPDILDNLSAEHTLHRRAALAGTAPARVKEAAIAARARLPQPPAT